MKNIHNTAFQGSANQNRFWNIPNDLNNSDNFPKLKKKFQNQREKTVVRYNSFYFHIVFYRIQEKKYVLVYLLEENKDKKNFFLSQKNKKKNY